MLLVAQGNDLLFRQFQVLLKFMTKIKKRITYPEVKIKVIFVGAFEGDDQQKLHAGQNDAPVLNGVKGVTDPGNYTFSNESGHKRATVAVPFKDTVIAEFSISSKDIFSAAKPPQFEYITLTSEWHVGGQILSSIHLVCCPTYAFLLAWSLVLVRHKP